MAKMAERTVEERLFRGLLYASDVKFSYEVSLTNSAYFLNRASAINIFNPF